MRRAIAARIGDEACESALAQATYHGDLGVFFEKCGDFGKLMLKVVDPNVADVGAL